ncbi:MAG: hypothetical protein MHMPM18_003278 [Marteilia pararefringens]
MKVLAAALLLVALFPLHRSPPGVRMATNFPRTPDVIYKIPLEFVLSTSISPEATSLMKSESLHRGLRQYFLRNFRVNYEITTSSTSHVYNTSDYFFNNFVRTDGIRVLITPRNNIAEGILGKMETSGRYDRGVIGFVIAKEDFIENHLLATLNHELLHALQSDHEISDRSTSIMKPENLEVSGYSVSSKSPHPTVALNQVIIEKITNNSYMPVSYKIPIPSPKTDEVASVNVKNYLTRPDYKNMPLLNFQMGWNQRSMPALFASFCSLACLLIIIFECLA